MKTSKLLMGKAGIYPKLQLGIKQERGGVQSTGPHTVRLISDKITLMRDRESGEIVEMVKYVVEEDGVKKEYRTRLKNKDTKELNYLVQHLSSVEEGTEVILEMKKMGPRNYVEVRNLDGTPIKVEGSEDTEGVSEEHGDDEEETVINLDDDNEPGA